MGRTLSVCLLVTFVNAARFNDTVNFPCKKITKDSTGFNIIDVKFTCSDVFPTIKKCAEQCFNKEKNGSGCVGFITNLDSSRCTLCNPATRAEIQNLMYTQINVNQILYIMRRNEKPDVYLPLEPENITGTVIVGDGASGNLIPENDITSAAGKVNQGLNFRNGARLSLVGSVNDCFANLSACGSVTTITMWIKPSGKSGLHHLTHSENHINIVFTNGRVWAWVLNYPYKLDYITSVSAVPVGDWTHVVVSYSRNTGSSLYVDGVLEDFRPFSDSHRSHSPYPIPYNYYISNKANGRCGFDGTVDEIQFFYKCLTNAGINILLNEYKQNANSVQNFACMSAFLWWTYCQQTQKYT